ncbi:MAG TPA: hypothetical protein VJT31_25930 [Rugosimonospora sp.]|nr:hypothetical protein [Rugosimonospora sp.]
MAGLAEQGHAEAVPVAEQAVAVSKADPYPGRDVLHAAALRTLADQYATAGRLAEAAHTAGQARDLYRHLRNATPSGFAGDLGYVSAMQAQLLRELDPPRALHAAQEAVGCYEALRRADPDRYLPVLVQTLQLRADCCEQAGRWTEAEPAWRRVVDMGQVLVAVDPRGQRPQQVWRLRRLAEALERVAHEYDTRRPTAAPGVWTQTVDTAMDAYQLSIQITDVTAAKEESAASALLLARLPDERPGAIQQRLHAAQHSANLYDELQQQQPDRFRANHACALVWHARLLDQTGQRQQAIDRSAKALLEYRDVVQRQTGHHTGLAGAATVYATLATDTDPLPFLQEAADAYHQAITEGEDAARPERARTHMLIADKLAQRKNQGRDTLTYSRAAVDEFIELAADNIITYGQEAVEHLLRHAQHLEKHGYTEASAFRHQARQINEQLRAVRTDADANDAP